MSREVSFRVHCVQYVAATFGCLNYLWCSSTKSSVSNFFESAYAVVIRIFSLVVCEVLKFSRFMIDWGASENNTGEDIRYRGKKMCSQHKNRKIPSSSSSVFIILRNTQISIWLISRLLSVSFFFLSPKNKGVSEPTWLSICLTVFGWGPLPPLHGRCCCFSECVTAKRDCITRYQ